MDGGGGEHSRLARVKGAHWHQGHLQSGSFSVPPGSSPLPHIRTPAFPQSPLPHQSTKTSPSLGRREKASRPPGLGRSTQSRLGTEQDALGKETIWSLKEPQGAAPGPGSWLRPGTGTFKGQLGSLKGLLTEGLWPELTPGGRTHTPPTGEAADSLTPPQHLPHNLLETPGYRLRAKTTQHCIPQAGPGAPPALALSHPPGPAPRPLQPGWGRGGEP